MSFYNICDLSITILPEQPKVDDDVENTTNSNEETNQENIDEEDELDQSGSESSEEEKPDKNIEESSESTEKSDKIVEEFDTHEKDSINELFFKVFANDSLLCDAKIEKPYYSAKIYPDVSIECGCLNVNKPAKDKYPHCSDCGSTSTNPKKSSMRTKVNKNKRKHVKANETT
ncbi:hypothetical protein C2G38_2225241 [Gigaspora rosea]|uniref:Uncharacterized protein n=1 Tax=Gigaspora rosea TaxID=44941 RepID=A0A397U142_9GLOM|nr:hypothetical protein C2G38_2225241 [Gigaspora rosea]